MRGDDASQRGADEICEREARAQLRTITRNPQHGQCACTEREEEQLQEQELRQRATFATATASCSSQSTFEYFKPSFPGSAPTPIT